MLRGTAVVIGCLCMLLALPGCWNRRELNDLAIALAVGIDKQGERYRVSVQIVNPQEIAARMGGSDNSPVTLYEETGQTLFECLRRMTTSAPRKVYMSHLRILVISEEVASEGIRNILDFFARDHELRTDFYVIVARGTEAKQVLGIMQPLEKVPANHMYKMLETSEQVWAPSKGVFLDELMNDLMSNGKEAALTGVRVIGNVRAGSVVDNLKTAVANAHIQYSNIGVFRGDKLVGWLTEEESKAFNYISGNVKSTIGVLPCPDGGVLNVEVIRADAKMKGEVINGKPKVELAIRIEENIGEVACKIDLTKMETTYQLERLAEKNVRTFIEQTIQKTQSRYRADIFGFGEAIHRDDPNAWKKLQSKWENEFPKLAVSVRVTVELRRTGTQTNSFINKIGR